MDAERAGPLQNGGECLLALCHSAETLGIAAYSELENKIYCGAFLLFFLRVIVAHCNCVVLPSCHVPASFPYSLTHPPIPILFTMQDAIAIDSEDVEQILASLKLSLCPTLLILHPRIAANQVPPQTHAQHNSISLPPPTDTPPP